MFVRDLWGNASFYARYVRYVMPYKAHYLRCRLLEMRHPGFSQKIGKTDISPIFIVGAGRSGNTLLARLLHETGRVHFGPENYTLKDAYLTYLQCLHEPWKSRVDRILLLLTNQADVWRWEKVDAKAVREYLLASQEHTLGNIIHAWYLHYGWAIGYPSECWGCKTPNLTPFVEWFQNVFPAAKFVYIVRDPKDVVISFSRTGIEPYNQKEKAELLWYYYNRFLFSKMHAPRGNILMVCYEDLAKNPDRTIRRLRKALDMEDPVEFVEFRNPDTKRKHLRKIEAPVRFYRYDEDLEIPSKLRELYREIVA